MSSAALSMGILSRHFSLKQPAFFTSSSGSSRTPSNFWDLNHRILALPPPVREKIEVHQVAAGARREKVRFSGSGTMISRVGEGDMEVDCVPLDELLAEESPTWIKMDIEGSEMDALAGARKIIGRDSPVLAICVYHKQDDVRRVPLLMSQMFDEYRFFLRPHEVEGWDLVCYAVPARRLKKRGGG